MGYSEWSEVVVDHFIEIGGTLVEVEYRKDLRHNYMIIKEEEDIPKELYCIRMLQNQPLAGVLPLQQHCMDNKTLNYYEITGKQSMLNLYTKASLSYERLKRLITSILSTLELAFEYLLPEDDFILQPEYIYLDVVTNTPFLSFLSGYRHDSKQQMNGLLEYLMNKVDYNDKEAVLLVYQLYSVSREEGFTFTHMYEVLHKSRKSEAESKVITDRDARDEISKLTKEIRSKEGDLIVEECSHTIDEVARIENQGQGAERKSLFRGIRNQGMSMEQNNYLSQIPVVMEKSEEEQEVLCYPIITYVFTGICVLAGILILVLGFTSGILYNSYGERIEYSKILGLALILLCVEAYLMRKIWDKENKLVKIVTKSEYIDPRPEGERISYDMNRKDCSDNEGNLTVSDSSCLTRREYNLLQSLSQNTSSLPNSSESQEALIPKPEVNISYEEDSNPTCVLSDFNPSKIKKAEVILRSLEEEHYTSISASEFPFFIGKLRKNVDYCIEKDVVSRYHAKITMEEERFYITDLNSTNGTFVNETMLQTYEKVEIRHGDTIALANLRFELVLS
jgi:hypothetical protein